MASKVPKNNRYSDDIRQKVMNDIKKEKTIFLF